MTIIHVEEIYSRSLTPWSPLLFHSTAYFVLGLLRLDSDCVWLTNEHFAKESDRGDGHAGEDGPPPCVGLLELGKDPVHVVDGLVIEKLCGGRGGRGGGRPASQQPVEGVEVGPERGEGKVHFFTEQCQSQRTHEAQLPHPTLTLESAEAIAIYFYTVKSLNRLIRLKIVKRCLKPIAHCDSAVIEVTSRKYSGWHE